MLSQLPVKTQAAGLALLSLLPINLAVLGKQNSNDVSKQKGLSMGIVAQMLRD